MLSWSTSVCLDLVPTSYTSCVTIAYTCAELGGCVLCQRFHCQRFQQVNAFSGCAVSQRFPCQCFQWLCCQPTLSLPALSVAVLSANAFLANALWVAVSAATCYPE